MEAAGNDSAIKNALSQKLFCFCKQHCTTVNSITESTRVRRNVSSINGRTYGPKKIIKKGSGILVPDPLSFLQAVMANLKGS